MLTNFYFDSEILDCTQLKTEIGNHNLLDTWSNYGCLHICKNNFDEVRKGVRRLDAKYVQKWNTALVDYTKNIIENSTKKRLSDFECVENLAQEVSDIDITTAIVPELYMEAFEPNISRDEKLEVTSPVHLQNSIYFNASRDNCLNSIDENESFDTIWESRLKGLAKVSNRITFIDRYLVDNAMDDHRNRRRTSLENFIEALSKVIRPGQDITFTIVSAYDTKTGPNSGEGQDARENQTNFDDVKRYINEVLIKKPYFPKKLKLSVSLCHDRYFKRTCHDRMFAFNDFVAEIGTGSEIFRESSQRRTTFTIKRRERTNFNKALGELNRDRKKTFRN